MAKLSEHFLEVARGINETIELLTRSDLQWAIDGTILNLDEDTASKMAKNREANFIEHVSAAISKAQAESLRESGSSVLTDDQLVQIAREYAGERSTRALEALQDRVSSMGLDAFCAEYTMLQPGAEEKRKGLAREIARESSFKLNEIVADIRNIASGALPKAEASIPKTTAPSARMRPGG